MHRLTELLPGSFDKNDDLIIDNNIDYQTVDNSLASFLFFTKCNCSTIVLRLMHECEPINKHSKAKMCVIKPLLLQIYRFNTFS